MKTLEEEAAQAALEKFLAYVAIDWDGTGYVTKYRWQSAERALGDMARIRFMQHGWDLHLEQRGRFYRIALRKPADD